MAGELYTRPAPRLGISRQFSLTLHNHPAYSPPIPGSRAVGPAMAKNSDALTLDSLGRDIRYALRQLRRSPGFAATALITLALGIGANIVVFGVLNAVLLHSLEVREPQSLYQLRHQAWASFRLITTSYPDFEDFRRRNTTFAGMAAIDAYSSAALFWHNAAIEVHGDEVTGNYFDLLGVEPQAGRFFHASR